MALEIKEMKIRLNINPQTSSQQEGREEAKPESMESARPVNYQYIIDTCLAELKQYVNNQNER